MKKMVYGIFLLSLAAPAFPRDANVTSDVATQHQLDVLNAENALLTVQLKNMELKRKIKNGGQEALLTPNNHQAVPFSSASQTQVLLVTGEPGRAVATLELNGAQVQVQAGQVIAGLGTVKAVGLNQVLVQGQHALFSVPFAIDSTSALSGGDTMNHDDMNSYGNHLSLFPLPNLGEH